MTAQLITPLPTPPSRQDPTDFSDRTEAFLLAMQRMAVELNLATPGDSAAGLAQYMALTGEGKGTRLMRHICPGTGAVERQLHERLNERISVRDFGAKGDGTTNDTVAIQRAIDYCENNYVLGTSTSGYMGAVVLFFPAGYYRLTAPIVVRKKIAFEGEGQSEYSSGTRLIQTANNADLITVDPLNHMSFSMERMSLRGNNTTGSGHLLNIKHGAFRCNSQRYIDCNFAQPQAMSMRLWGDDIVIDHCLFDVSQQSGECIQLGSNTAGDLASNIRITRCDFFTIQKHCVLAFNTYGVVFANNIVSQQGAGNGDLYTASVFDAHDTSPVLCKRISITGNVIEGGRRLFAFSNARDIAISGNVASDCGVGTAETYHAISLAGVTDNVSISGNVLHGTYNNQSFIAALGTQISNVSITGNNFWNEGGPAPAISAGNMTGKVVGNNFFGFLDEVLCNDHMALGLVPNKMQVLPYSTSIASDWSVANEFVVTASNTTGFTIGTPQNASVGQTATYTIKNGTASSTLGTLTWGPLIKAGTWTQPAAGFSRSITFRYDGTNVVEVGRTPVDVPN